MDGWMDRERGREDSGSLSHPLKTERPDMADTINNNLSDWILKLLVCPQWADCGPLLAEPEAELLLTYR